MVQPRMRALILPIISLVIYHLCSGANEEMDLLTAQRTLMNSGIGIDLEESHIEDVRAHENLPAAYQRVLDSLLAEAETCVPTEKYRRADGVCNNLKEPLQGAVLHFQKRLLPNAYLDGKSVPRMLGKNQFYLSSARKVSLDCFPPNEETFEYFDKRTSQMSMQWGQYIDHDLVFTEVMAGGGCCSDPRHTCVHPDTFSGGPCFPIGIDAGDRHFNETCMNFKRSFSINVKGVQEQISGVTSYMDASTVYGSNQALQDRLRSKQGGLLKVENDNTLPYQGPLKCRKDLRHISHCPESGDVRVNVFPGLTLLHLVFLREHNRLATKLAEINPHWDDEKLFQETRRIIIALHQKIHYEEFLPHVIGDDAMTFFGLKSGGFKYDPDIDTGIINEFAVAAFRYGHSQINGLLHTNGKLSPISESYFQPWTSMETEGKIKKVIKDQCKKNSQKTNKFFTRQVTDLLFLDVDAIGHSTDLGARNVQRGRDHGIPPYLEYLDLAVKKFIRASNSSYDSYTLPTCLSKKAYESSSDIDLFVGGLHETPMPGALVGPTFAYILGEQFRRLKYGDRFFFETDDLHVGFSRDQLKAVKKLSFSHVICRNTENKSLQPDVFAVVDDTKNKNLACSEYEDIDLSPWKDPFWVVGNMGDGSNSNGSADQS